MPLLVVPCAASESERVTLGEWRKLLTRGRVVFEREAHPLADLLRDAGIEVDVLTEDPDASDAMTALVVDPGSPRIVVLARAGAEVSAGMSSVPDDLTAAHGSYVGRDAQASLGSLAYIMARLRSSDGCPWDREQDHASLTVHLVEEAHEVLDAIDRGAWNEELEEELGDLLLQVFFHAQMAHDEGRFDVAGVADRIVTKLIARHPHVFGDVDVATAGEVVANWEAIKAKEKKRTGPFEDVPVGLPALAYAHKIQKRATGAGFSISEEDALARAESALAAGELGSALFWTVAVARARHLDAEGELRREVVRFRDSR